jgi:hypothetical protein
MSLDGDRLILAVRGGEDLENIAYELAHLTSLFLVQLDCFVRCLGYLLGDSPLQPPIETLIEDCTIALESSVGVSSTNHGL